LYKKRILTELIVLEIVLARKIVYAGTSVLEDMLTAGKPGKKENGQVFVFLLLQMLSETKWNI
jgi:hypothetical protein